MFFGKFGEDFAVEADSGFFELIYQFAVGKAILARGGVDFDVPKRAEISFLFSAVVECVDAGVQKRFFGRALF